MAVGGGGGGVWGVLRPQWGRVISESEHQKGRAIPLCELFKGRITHLFQNFIMRISNLFPRALFPGFGGGVAPPPRKRPGDEVGGFQTSVINVNIPH